MLRHECDVCKQPFTPGKHSFESTDSRGVRVDVTLGGGRTTPGIGFNLTIGVGSDDTRMDVCTECVARVLAQAADHVKHNGNSK
jgi:hypothetical protein